MQVGRNFRIYPTESQKKVLSQWIGCQRVIRNAKIDEASYLHWLKKNSIFSARVATASSEVLENKTLNQGFSQFKGDANPWLREVPSQVLRNGVYRAKNAYSNFFAGTAKYPHRKRASGSQSVLLTSELFSMEEGVLMIGTKKSPVGKVKWVAHRDYQPPKMITVSRHGDGTWECSFTFDDGKVLPSEDDLLTQHSFSPIERIHAFDRGVANPLFCSTGEIFDLSAQAKKRIALLSRSITRQQQKLSRKKNGSNNRAKTKTRISKLYRKKNLILTDWQEKTSLAVASADCDVIGMENLSLGNMTRAPKPKPSSLGDGTYLQNKASAKAGLNRALLGIALGRVCDRISHKSRRNGKAFVKVPSHHSSQECHECGHTDPGNRPSQAEFYCQACGYRVHADYNASLVARSRTFLYLQSCRPRNRGDNKRSARLTALMRSSHPIAR